MCNLNIKIYSPNLKNVKSYKLSNSLLNYVLKLTFVKKLAQKMV